MNQWNNPVKKGVTVAVKTIISVVCISGLAGLLVSLSACTTGSPDTGFDIRHLNPDTMVDPTAFGYSQIVTVNNGRTIYLAGQGPT